MDSDVIKSDCDGKRSKMIRSVKKQICDVDTWRGASAEFIATFIFLFIVSVTYILPQDLNSTSKSNSANKEYNYYMQASIGIALAYATLIQCFENISGGFMNPAISVAMAVAGHITIFKAIILSVAQMTGAFSAVALCFGMFPNSSQAQRALFQSREGITSAQCFGIETLQSFILTITWLATYATSKNHLGSSALPVGMAVLGNSLWAAPLSESNANPARSVAPAVLLQYWSNLWVFVIAPVIGGVFGALLYSHVFLVASRKKNRRAATSTGRNIEGESVKSDQDAVEQLPSLNQEVAIQTTKFATPRSVEPTATPYQQPQRAFVYSQTTVPSTPHALNNVTASSLTRPNYSNQAPFPKFYRQSSAPPPRALSMIQPLSYAPSNGSNSTNVTLTRESSRVASRSSTACGPLSPKNIANAQTHSMISGHNISSSNAMDPLLNNGVL